MRPICLLLALIVAVSSCNLAEAHKLGVWNLEVLHPTKKRGFPELKKKKQLPARGDAELEKIADYLLDKEVDAVVVTEVAVTHKDGSKPRSTQLDTIVEKAGASWEYFLGRSGGNMHIGIVFNSETIKIKAVKEFEVDEFTVQGKIEKGAVKARYDIFDRDPFVVWISLLEDSGEWNDLLMIGLHLKSVQANRDNHLAAMAKLLGDLGLFQIDNGIDTNEKDVLILGDLNDSSHTLKRFRYLFDYLNAKGYRHLQPSGKTYPETRVNGSQIDHIFASRALRKNGLKPKTFHIHSREDDGISREDFRKVYSDHYLLTVDVDPVDDTD